MTQKKLYVIILSFFTIIIGVVCFSLGNYFDTNSLATEKLKTQISAREENTSSLTDTKNDLESQINDLNSELSTKTTVNNYFREAKKKNDKLKTKSRRRQLTSFSPVRVKTRNQNAFCGCFIFVRLPFPDRKTVKSADNSLRLLPFH